MKTPIPTPIQPTAHHRAVTGRPLGNSSSRNVTRPPGNSSVRDQLTNHAAHTPAAGRADPASAYRAYSPASARHAVTRPVPSKNQPIGLDDRRDATTPPTTA